jgi:hypothetical protein
MGEFAYKNIPLKANILGYKELFLPYNINLFVRIKKLV